MDSSGPSATTASSTTLFSIAPSSPDAHSSDTILDDPHAAGLDLHSPTVEPKKGTTWLAPTPMSFMSDLRYSRRDKLNYNKVPAIEAVPAVNRMVFRPDTVGTLGWKAYEHPEGSVYFRAANFCTNLWLCDPVAVEAIEEVVEKIRASLASFPELSGRDIEFGLDLIDDEEPGAAPGDKLGCYYAVDMTSHEVFWLDEVSWSFYYNGVSVQAISREQVGLGARMSYWWVLPYYGGTMLSISGPQEHCYMFPHGRSFPSDTVGDLCAMLSYNMFDRLTSTSSVCPYNEDDARRLFHMFRDMEASGSSGEHARPEHVVMIARMQSTLLREKLLHFHGERYAQLDSNKSVFEEDPEGSHHSAWFGALSRLFFSLPNRYFEQLNLTWVDNKVNYDTWRTFISELQDDWARYTIPASIILAANVAFLAVQSIGQGGFAGTDQTTSQIASYVSTLLNIGCIGASLILTEQHRTSSHGSAEAAVAYLCDRALSKGGVERLAVIYSIPAALFRWGLISFATAIFWLALQNASDPTQITICVVAGLTALLLVAIIYNGEWKSRFSASPLMKGVKCVQRLVRRAFESVMVTTRPKLPGFRNPRGEKSILPQ